MEGQLLTLYWHKSPAPIYLESCNLKLNCKQIFVLYVFVVRICVSGLCVCVYVCLSVCLPVSLCVCANKWRRTNQMSKNVIVLLVCLVNWVSACVCVCVCMCACVPSPSDAGANDTLCVWLYVCVSGSEFNGSYPTSPAPPLVGNRPLFPSEASRCILAFFWNGRWRIRPVPAWPVNGAYLLPSITGWQ